MHNTRSSSLVSKWFSAVALVVLLFASFATAGSRVVRAQGPVPPTPAAGAGAQTGIQPLAADGSSFYYYADGKRLPLTPSLDRVAVKFASTNPIEQYAALLKSGAPLNLLEKPRHIPSPELSLFSLRQGATPRTLVQAVNSMRALPGSFLAVNPVFQIEDAEMAVSDEFIATFPSGKSPQDIKVYNVSHGVEMVSRILGQDNTFVLKVTAAARLDALAMANLYQESGAATNAAPDFVRMLPADPAEGNLARASVPGPMAAGTNDVWYSDQWALNNLQQYGTWMKSDADVDAPEAWHYTIGRSSVVIAVIDEGVELTQEDLKAKLVTGYDATGHGSAGGPCVAPCGNEDDAHGTNVAGLAAAASNNTIGIAGVCRGCRIMPIRIAYGDGSGHWITSDSWIANGITWAYQHGASILSNSWGGGSASTVINNAFSNAKTLGRGGKGSVILVAAGNSNLSTVSYPASLPTVIAVGASNMCDQRKTPTLNLCNGNEDFWGSNYGSALDISAPGVRLTSTDRMGSAGYSPGNYYNYFNGTSGATPIASGVAGLVLSVNPNLTAAQVQAILQNSADDVNKATNPGWDQFMGYGRVNANRAVVAAALTKSVQSTAAYDGSVLESTETSSLGGSINAAATTFNLGDDASNRQYRAILSFDTSSLPDNAVISSVTLNIRQAGHVGALNPFTTLGNILVDVRQGTFGALGLETADFQALSSRNGVLTITNNPVNNVYSKAMASSYFGYINKLGVTQFRLRFAIDDNNNHVADYLMFYSGNYATTTSYRPTLVIRYVAP